MIDSYRLPSVRVLIQMKLDPYKLFSVSTCIYLYICIAKIFIKAYTCFEIGSRCCCLHVKFDHPVNQNCGVPMHVVQNIGTGMPVKIIILYHMTSRLGVK